MPDLFAYLLSGQARAEVSIASTSQMYDPRARTWAVDLLREFSLPAHILPQIVPSGTALGHLRDDVSRECGTSSAPVIAPAAHDTASSVAAVPASGKSWCYISSGTWSLMGVELDEPLINEKALAYQYTNEVGVDGKIRFLKNIMGLWLVQECRRHWQREGADHTYAELTGMAERAESFVSLINPDHNPFLSPGDMVGKIDHFCAKTGQRPPHTRGEYVRSALEGLALTYRRTLDGLEDVLGRRIEVIHIVGGGTQNQLLCQMAADACGRTVVAGPVESTSIGNILTQAMAVGQIKNLAEARAIVRESFEVKTYTPGGGADWQKAYARFKDLLKAS
jgi:rhamnulokinase